MKKKHFTPVQIVQILKEFEQGKPVAVEHVDLFNGIYIYFRSKL